MMRRDDYIPFDEPEYSDIERIAKDVARAQSKEDILILLAQVARQFEQDGAFIDSDFIIEDAAQGLVVNLHNAILLRDGSKRKYYRTALTYNRAVQCTVLITAIEMMLRFSPETLVDKPDLMREELVPSIPKLLKLLLTWEGGETIRLLAISNTIKIIRRVGPNCQEATDAFVEALLSVLRSHIGPANPEVDSIHVEAAHAIAQIFDQQDRTASRKRVIGLIQDDSSHIISTLSTAALATTNSEDDEEILTCLFSFAVNSHTFRTKMAKRRCTILAIGRHLKRENEETRKLALNICKCLLNDQTQTTAAEPVRMDSNSELLVSKVVDSALNELEPMLQLYAISMLGDAIRNAHLPLAVVNSILYTLKTMVGGDESDDVVMEASVTYSKAASTINPDKIETEILGSIAEFTTLPFARARAQAISTIDFFAQNEQLAWKLVSETEMMENFSLIITYGSDEDCADAINVVRLLARNPSYHRTLCQNSSFLGALVHVVTKEEVVNRNAYVGGVETCLALLANNDNIKSFLPYPDLLPFFVSLANTSVHDEELKKKLVSAIVRLSSAILG
ncbi:expressed unknown protein [Seminavis robusta]|uniref:Uncharacterized protein n=1 Tax=Seminavis robusta TaxID=568900 RepID=A0A9N8E143_9STRA|nr:expressed unknown protein [Seminavis robusta]|eukprot:Sro545_g163810.1 n/a (565) ;mRNA; f:10929-12694